MTYKIPTNDPGLIDEQYPDVPPSVSEYVPDTQAIALWDYRSYDENGNPEYDLYSYRQLVDWGVLDPGMPKWKLQMWLDSDKAQNRFGEYLFGSGSTGRRGSGSGAAAPVYEAPNRAALEEQVKTYVVATTGTANKQLIDKAVDAALDADRREFDRRVADAGGEVIDPTQYVKEVVRNSAQYQTIHALRPESVDELEWVVGRQETLRQLGLSASRAESLGIKQAQVGSNTEALVDAAEMQFNSDTGRLLRAQRERLKQSAMAAVSLV